MTAIVIFEMAPEFTKIFRFHCESNQDPVIKLLERCHGKMVNVSDLDDEETKLMVDLSNNLDSRFQLIWDSETDQAKQIPDNLGYIKLFWMGFAL